MNIKFISECTEEELLSFENKFNELISPVYGDQTQFLNKIYQATDRDTLLLFSSKNLVGIAVYKKNLSDEFVRFKVSSGLEIKTFLIFSEKHKFYGYYASFLFNKLASKAIELGAKCLFGTISEMKAKHLNYFRKMQFHEVKSFENYKGTGKKEILIRNKNPFGLWEQTDAYLTKLQKKEKCYENQH